MGGASLSTSFHRVGDTMAVNRRFCVGLTGGIGSGKTTVAHFFAELGITVIDADSIAREVTAPGTPDLTAIASHFGADILTPAGALDRKKLRQIIFNDAREKIWLEQRLHPLILNLMRARIRHVSSPYCILVIPLLAEVRESIDFLDRICVVDAPELLRKQWAAQRDQVSPSEIEAIMSNQYAEQQRLALADDIITNHSDLQTLQTQVQKLHQHYLTLCNRC